MSDLNNMMEFLSWDPISKKLSLKKSAIPEPAPNEVLIKVAYSGICGTDLHIMENKFPGSKQDGPFTLGHESCGTIQSIGSAVKAFKIGQRVAIDPNDACNTCDECHKGKYHFCQNTDAKNTCGIIKDGGWATHIVVKEWQVHSIPDDVELAQAALTEPLSCITHGWDLTNPITVGTRVLIIGAGIIGMLWSAVLHLHGLRKTVIISEVQAKRREIVKEFDLGYEVKSPTELEGQEFDLAIDCSGSGPAIEGALRLLGRGGRLLIFGVAHPQTKVTIEPFQVYKKELQIIGTCINPFSFPSAVSLLQAMSNEYLNYEKLGVGVYKLSEYAEAFETLKRGDISKAIFRV